MTASAKNDTPRTDAIVHNGTCVDAVNKYREISRQLETEVQELREALQELLFAWVELQGPLDGVAVDAKNVLDKTNATARNK